MVNHKVKRIAARLQDAAKAGQIFVSRNTYRLTRGAFAFQEMDPIKVKGKRDPLTVYEILHAKLQPDKSRGVEGLSSPLVGREAGRKALVECLEKLQTGRGQVAAILGEAGIGKSRLLAEIRRREGKDLTWLEGRSFAFSRSLGYGAILDLLRRFAGIADEDAEAEAAASLKARLGGILPGDLESYAVLAQLLSMRLDTKEAADVGAVTGEAFRNRLFAVLERLLLALAKQKPVVVVLEDLHWADQSSLELLDHHFRLITQAPIAFVLLSRPKQESSGNWEKLGPPLEGCRPYLLEIPLKPLSGVASGDLVCGLLDGSLLPTKLSEVIQNKSEGNPFFVEEVLRSLVERGVPARENGVWKITDLVENIQVPNTELPPAKCFFPVWMRLQRGNKTVFAMVPSEDKFDRCGDRSLKLTGHCRLDRKSNRRNPCEVTPILHSGPGTALVFLAAIFIPGGRQFAAANLDPANPPLAS